MSDIDDEEWQDYPDGHDPMGWMWGILLFLMVLFGAALVYGGYNKP